MLLTTIPVAFLCLALSIVCAVLFIGLIRVRRTIAALKLQSTQQQAERAEVDAIKDELIANVSHELRTPLTSIRGALGLLSITLADRLDPRSQHLFRIALTNTDRLIRLVTDILDLERMQSGQAALHLRRCSLTQIVQQAIDTLSPTADAAQISLTFTPPDRLEAASYSQTAPPADLPDRRRQPCPDTLSPDPAYCDADPDRILQVLTNLLSNAVKFSPPQGTVTVSLTANPATLHLRVTDHGRGIPREKLEAIFDRFQQVETGDSRQKGGAGLGLAICRTIVQQHGGTIWAECNSSKGATLCVELPRLQRFNDQPQEPQCAVSSSSMTKTISVT